MTWIRKSQADSNVSSPIPSKSVQRAPSKCNKIDNFPDLFGAPLCVCAGPNKKYIEEETPTRTERDEQIDSGKHSNKYRTDDCGRSCYRHIYIWFHPIATVRKALRIERGKHRARGRRVGWVDVDASEVVMFRNISLFFMVNPKKGNIWSVGYIASQHEKLLFVPFREKMELHFSHLSKQVRSALFIIEEWFSFNLFGLWCCWGKETGAWLRAALIVCLSLDLRFKTLSANIDFLMEKAFNDVLLLPPCKTLHQ